jgi:PhzF family phenazine biosynthesis protein
VCSCNCRVRDRSPTASTIQVETPLGIIAAHRIDDSSKPLVMVEQFPPTFAERAPNIDSVAEVLNLSPINIRTDIPIQSVSTSGSKLIVPINDVRNLQGLKPNFEALWSLCDDYDTTGLYPFVVTEARETLAAEARQFPKRSGLPEDPATGVAASAISAYCAANKLTVDNEMVRD